MEKLKRYTRHQHEFLKKMREHPHGLPASEWPSATAFRRWMRHPGFRRAIESIRQTLQIQTDLHLLSAAAHASTGLAAILAPGNPESPKESPADAKASIAPLVQLLRLAHWRLKELRQAEEHRAEIEANKPPEEDPLALIHPSVRNDPIQLKKSLDAFGLPYPADKWLPKGFVR